jgi:hypothetical protein
MADEPHASYPKPSNSTLTMMEELLKIFEETVLVNKKIRAEFDKILKKKFVENAERYAFLDPFAGEFEYDSGRIIFSGFATDRELVEGITNSIKQLTEELGMVSQFLENSAAWSQRYSNQLAEFNAKLDQ